MTEPRELLCMVCDRDYPVWFAPNRLWNPVMRRPDGSDEYPFICPTCFGNIAVQRGVKTPFVFFSVGTVEMTAEHIAIIDELLEDAEREAYLWKGTSYAHPESKSDKNALVRAQAYVKRLSEIREVVCSHV